MTIHGPGKAKLTELLERVRAATGPDQELECDLVEALISASEAGKHFNYDLAAYRFTASIDAALALVERMLPGWDYGIDKDYKDQIYWCHLYPATPPNTHSASSAPTAPLAILAALLSALSQIDNTGGGEE